MRKKATVRTLRQLSPSVRALVLDVPGGLVFEAGQWINVFVPGPLGEQKRAYSLASAPSDEWLELAITEVSGGEVSPRLHALAPGDSLEIDGPYGFFTRDGEAAGRSALFIATGTGIAPIRSMLRALHARAVEGPPHVLLFGCRTQEDALYIDELRALGPSRLRVEVTLSRPQPGYLGRVGHVQAHVAELAGTLDAPHAFVCGLSPMVNDVRALCKAELGFDRKRIHTERFDA